MSNPPFLMSRKILHSIDCGIDRINSRRFDERDIKLLLIDLRELAKYVSSRVDKEDNITTKGNKNFIDICDFIAHAKRDQGVMERMIREQLRRFQALPDTATVQDFLNVPIHGVLRADLLVASMAHFAYLGLAPRDKNRDPARLSAFIQNSSEIELCIMSLLQDSLLKLKEGEGLASLHIQPRDGVFKLYCNVFNTKIEQHARQRTSGRGHFALSFPVMRSTVQLLDYPEYIFSDNGLEPAFYETYRSDCGRLALQRILTTP